MVRLYIAGTSREVVGDGSGRLDGLLISSDHDDVAHRVRILESFKYVQPWQVENIGRFKSFMLDSGAFTFMQRGMGKVDPMQYVRKYANYVRDNDVQLFFEFDIDKISSKAAVDCYRRLIEKVVGRRCIPVWHVQRGESEWERLCDEYDYVAIGDMGSDETKAIYGEIPSMIQRAHDLGAIVHGLGVGGLTRIRKFPFDTVDSASWTWGVRGHFMYDWDGSKMHYNGFYDGESVDRTWLTRHNFMEWVRMSEDLERLGND